ncbi:MAG: hypothetical protein ACI86H_000428 [bacterium]|jgi:hypothetical protein
MSQYLNQIIDFSQKLSLDVIHTDEAEELIVVNNEENGIYNLVIDCEYPVLIMEQLIYKVNSSSEEHYRRLLQMNRSLIHGAFVLDENGENVIFRDSLQLENLDFNEFEGSINALVLGLVENASELLQINK